LGVDYLHAELKRTHNIRLEAVKPYEFASMGDKFGWSQSADGLWHCTIFVEGGKLADRIGYPAKTAIREVAKIHTGSFILTGNQNLVIAQVPQELKPKIVNILKKHNVADNNLSQLRKNSIACAALPLCGLAFAEAERYLPSLVDKLDKVLEANNLQNEPITIRMTGCPNGCGRPFLAEIGLVGRAPGKYNLYLGAGFTGERLNKLYSEMLSEEEIIEALTPILEDFSKNRDQNEHFGNFVIRRGYVKAVTEGNKFHE